MYHYVRPDHPDLPYFRHLHVDDFRKQLDYFQRNFYVLSLEELSHALGSGRPVPNGIVLTFDDGFKDHYRFVLPELAKRDIPGIFYVSTYPYLSGRLLDVHRIHVLIGRFGGKTIFESLTKLISDDFLSHNHVKEFHSETYRTQSNDDYTNRVKRTLNYFIDYQYRGKVIDSLMNQFFPDEQSLADDFYLRREEIKEMHEAGMLIGSHTVNHPCMSKLSVDEQRYEIFDSFRFLEGITGSINLKTFCYPYGGFHSFTKDTERLLDEVGCVFSFNVEKRDISADDLSTRRQALPRYDCNLFPDGSSRALEGPACSATVN